MTRMEKGSVEYMLALTLKLHQKRIITSCLTCQHFNEAGETCALAPPPYQRPPARTIATGCAQWDEGLPF